VVVLVPGRRERADREAAGLEVALDDLAVVPSADRVVAGDVVGVRVRRQQVRDGQPVPRDGVEQRPEGRPGVDEHGRPAFLVADQVGVRKPVWMHAPLDDHGRSEG
jgi:hypothetical protein